MLSGFYIRGDAGGSASESIRGDLADLATGNGGGFGGDLGTSPLVGVGAGVILPYDFRTDVTVSWRGTFGVSHQESDPNSGLFLGAKSTNSHSLAVLANLYYDINLGSVFTPYVGAGVGFAYNSLGDVTYTANGTTTSTEDGDDKVSLAWAAMAGVAYQATSAIQIDLGYRYLDAGEFRSSGVVKDTLGNTLSASPVTADLHAHEVQVGLRYTF